MGTTKEYIQKMGFVCYGWAMFQLKTANVKGLKGSELPSLIFLLKNQDYYEWFTSQVDVKSSLKLHLL